MTGEKKRTRKAKTVKPTRTLEEVALDTFAETGDVTGLGVLADWLDEFQPERAEYAAQLREVMNGSVHAEDVRFHFSRSGFVDRPTAFGSAIRLTEAEEWFRENEAPSDRMFREVGQVNVRWEEDEFYSADHYDCPDMPQIGWECWVQVWTRKGWTTLASLHGITFSGDGDFPSGYSPRADRDYRRDVEAELLAEARAALAGQN